RPEARPVVRKRAALEVHVRDVFDFRRTVARVDAREEILLAVFVIGSERIKDAPYDDYAADTMRRLENCSDFAGRVQGKNFLVIPLTDVKTVAVEGELRTGVFGTRNRAFVFEIVTWDIPADDSMILG